MARDTTTVGITDINRILNNPEAEARCKPAALLIVGGDMNGTIFDLRERCVEVGRSPENAICVDQDELSRRHFRLLESSPTHELQDCGSTNGTYVNNRRVEGIVQLAPGDLIKAGLLALKYLPKGDPERLIYDQLTLDANTDRHTGCYNKSYFQQHLARETGRCRLNRTALALIVLDLDHFKDVNDRYGHDAGDYVLAGMAALVRQQGLRAGDLFARYGGEEFVVVLPGASLQSALQLANRLRDLLEKAVFNYHGQLIPVTMSAGVAEFDPGMADSNDLFRKADSALLRAKSAGRNRVVGK